MSSFKNLWAVWLNWLLIILSTLAGRHFQVLEETPSAEWSNTFSKLVLETSGTGGRMNRVRCSKPRRPWFKPNPFPSWSGVFSPDRDDDSISSIPNPFPPARFKNVYQKHAARFVWFFSFQYIQQNLRMRRFYRHKLTSAWRAWVE